MVRLANPEDLVDLTLMLHDMSKELWGDDVKDDLDIYESVIRDHFHNFKDTIFIDSRKRGFFIVREETEPFMKKQIYNGIRVYIKPKYRKGRLLKQFYDKMFETFDGEIWGMTEAHSEHIKVLDKRHTLVAKVYKLERG